MKNKKTDRDDANLMEVDETIHDSSKQSSNSDNQDLENTNSDDSQTESEEKPEEIEIKSKINQRPKRDRKLLYHLRKDYILYTHSDSDEIDPQDLKTALNSNYSSEWKNAMNKEMNSIRIANVFTLVPSPPGKTAIDLKWLFKIKRKQDGSIDRFKARLVARGFMQEYGRDYSDTYAPVASYTTIRILLAFAVKNGAYVFAGDAETAFLNGDLPEEIFVKQPQPFKDSKNKDYVWKLNKAIYGLKQGSRCWNKRLTQILIELDFVQLNADPCVFIFRDNNGYIILVIYVDDLIIITNQISYKDDLIKQLNNRITVKDLGELKSILNIKIDYDKDQGIMNISQENYVKRLLRKFRMPDCKTSTTPLNTEVNLSDWEQYEDSLSPEKDRNKFPSRICWLNNISLPDNKTRFMFPGKYT